MTPGQVYSTQPLQFVLQHYKLTDLYIEFSSQTSLRPNLKKAMPKVLVSCPPSNTVCRAGHRHTECVQHGHTHQDRHPTATQPAIDRHHDDDLQHVQDC